MASAVCFPKSESVGESAASTVETCNVTIQRGVFGTGLFD
jgi:hypothetical protein